MQTIITYIHGKELSFHHRCRSHKSMEHGGMHSSERQSLDLTCHRLSHFWRKNNIPSHTSILWSHVQEGNLICLEVTEIHTVQTHKRVSLINFTIIHTFRLFATVKKKHKALLHNPYIWSL